MKENKRITFDSIVPIQGTSIEKAKTQFYGSHLDS